MTHLTSGRYYKLKAKDYFYKTSTLDSTSYLLPFTTHLKANDSLLDLGCGSGRDLLLLKNMGFRPKGVEQSQELASLAHDFSGCPVVHGDFRNLDFAGYAVNALMFSASLVHLPYELVEPAIKNTLPALNQGGFIYVSLKQGRGIRVDTLNRTFFLWEHGDAQMLFESMGLRILDFQESPSVLNENEIWLSYTMYHEP